MDITHVFSDFINVILSGDNAVVIAVIVATMVWSKIQGISRARDVLNPVNYPDLFRKQNVLLKQASPTGNL